MYIPCKSHNCTNRNWLIEKSMSGFKALQNCSKIIPVKSFLKNLNVNSLNCSSSSSSSTHLKPFFELSRRSFQTTILSPVKGGELCKDDVDALIYKKNLQKDLDKQDKSPYFKGTLIYKLINAALTIIICDHSIYVLCMFVGVLKRVCKLWNETIITKIMHLAWISLRFNWRSLWWIRRNPICHFDWIISRV